MKQYKAKLFIPSAVAPCTVLCPAPAHAQRDTHRGIRARSREAATLSGCILTVETVKTQFLWSQLLRDQRCSWFVLSFSFCVLLQSDLLPLFVFIFRQLNHVYARRFSLQVTNLEFPTPGLGKLTVDKSPKRKVSEENRECNYVWTDSFDFTANDAALPVCLICGEELANNKKCNVERQ